MAARGPAYPRPQLVRSAWAPLNGAQSYELQISADIEFNAPIGGTRLVESTTFSPNPTLPAGSYYWRVRGLTTTNQPGPWSSIGTLLYF